MAFLNGDIVRCIQKPSNTIAKPLLCHRRITVGQIYQVIRADDKYVTIKNDLGIEVGYSVENFKLEVRFEPEMPSRQRG